jgi:hypothetical protein
MASTFVSLEQYLNTSFHPDREYVHGVVVERGDGTPSHGRLHAVTGAFLAGQEQAARLRVFTSGRLRTHASRYRVPDVMVVEKPYRKANS